jgi:ribosome maturation factor RimP
MAGVATNVYATIERTVEGLGYELVDVERMAAGLLRVTLDAPNGVGLDDCERVSRQLSHLFAVEDVDYERLEVSSPGLDRPLKRVRDFRRFAGAEVQVELATAVPAAGTSAGRKRLRGRLLDVAGTAGSERARIELTPDAPPPKPGRGKAGGKAGSAVTPASVAVVEFPLADVVKARLVPQLDFRGRGGKVAAEPAEAKGAGGTEPAGAEPAGEKTGARRNEP